MTEIRGTLELIEFENENGHSKSVLTLSLGKTEVVFIEFQGYLRALANGLIIGQKYAIKIAFNGKRSRLGKRYNKIIVKSIKQL